jgi:hypothetical protein
MVTVSADGFTVTLTFPVELRPVVELVAVTVNDKVLGAVLGGTVGAVNVCCAPFVPETVERVTPAGAVQV